MFALLFSCVPLVVAQTTRSGLSAAHVIVPQCRSYAITATVQIARVDVRTHIVERLATTVLEISLVNPTSSRLESQLLIPVPNGAVVRSFDFLGQLKQMDVRILPRAEAERIYRDLVARMKDPALLEFAGQSFVQSSVFPVEPASTQKLRVVYENLLNADGNRIDYVVPRTESLEYKVPWTIEAIIESKSPIATLYSPSHAIETMWHTATPVNGKSTPATTSSTKATVRVSTASASQPGPFRLSILGNRDGMSASLVAAPDAKTGGGYFLLLAGAPNADRNAKRDQQKREVTLVIDRSGSMHGEKIEQVREAGLQVLAGLGEGEAFNIIDYQTGVDQFAPQPVVKTRETELAGRAYLKALQPGGGTNMHEALKMALDAAPVPGTLPIVLFLTDGLPTVGQTSEIAIRDLLKSTNPHHRRVFTFGVGVDVNTPLLEAVALESRATSSFVLPKENVEVKVADLFKRLSGPVLTDPVLQVVRADGSPAMGRVQDLMPARLPDLFEGDQLVVLGKYIGTEPLEFKLRGNYLGTPREFTYRFDLGKSSTENSFVPRLWASRRIAILVDAVRRLGADSTSTISTTASPVPANDPRFKELVDEIVRLSTDFGILTEYTAFLALEGTDFGKRLEIFRSASDLLEKRAMNCRSGWASVNQSLNNGAQLSQKELKPRNGYLDQEMKAVEIGSVQQIHDKCFYRKGNRWIDSTVIAQESKLSRTIEFGSDEFFLLVRELASQGRAGALTLKGEIVLEVDGKSVLIKAP